MVRQLEKIMPRYTWLPVSLVLLTNLLSFYGSALLNLHRTHYNLTTALDAHIPLTPFFVLFYVLAYVQWVVGFCLIVRESRAVCYRLIAGEILAKLCCMVIFLILPTAMERPEITGGGVWNALLRLVYLLDRPVTLFPSIHCLESWFCFRGALYLKKPPRWYPWLSLVMTLLVCASTVLVKQHLAVDIPSALLVAELGLWLSRRLDAGRALRALNRRLRLDE